MLGNYSVSLTKPGAGDPNPPGGPCAKVALVLLRSPFDKVPPPKKKKKAFALFSCE